MKSTPVENSTTSHTEIMVNRECGNEINPGRKLHQKTIRKDRKHGTASYMRTLDAKRQKYRLNRPNSFAAEYQCELSEDRHKFWNPFHLVTPLDIILSVSFQIIQQ